MTTITDRWGIQPDHFWLHGRQPEQPVRYDENAGMWQVYGYPETVQILMDPATYLSDVTHLMGEQVAASSLKDGDLTQMDGLEHRKLRKLVSSAFTPKTVADLEPRIVTITRELLDAVADADQVELVADLAYTLPVTVIAELLGVPSSDRSLFKQWADQMLAGQTQFLEETTSGGDPDHLLSEGAEDAFRPMLDYFREHAAERRRQPREDLLTRLVQAEVDGERLTDTQIVNFANLLLVAGHITTTMLLGNTILCLDAHPDQAARVREDRSALPAAIEEALRYLSPIGMTIRATSTDVELGGQRIPADQMVMVWFSAANRDPREFPDPEVFDAARDPNPHLGFGRGVHFCMGAPLARLESRVALNLLLDRFPKLRTDPDNPPTFLESPAFTGVRTLPLHTR